jgi:1-acyl-sn-glycerol-3-phosphate acyltransferase
VFFLIPAITVYTMILGAASIASSLFDRHGHFAHRCARVWSWLILETTGVRVTVRGLERLTPGTTYVFVSNHQSIYDTPVIFSSLPYQLRIIAKESLARFPVLGWHLKRGRHLFVDRRRPGCALQGRELSIGDRGRSAGRAHRRHRYAPRDAERPSPYRTGRCDVGRPRSDPASRA